jgi:mannosyl-glycoprotein endo-beta-N-acetylglucosaminidase/stage II sporulation protein P
MMTRQEYVAAYKDTAVDSVRGTTLFPSVVMAQAIIESADAHGNAGEGVLSKYFNNDFGIKAGLSWKGKKVSANTIEYYGHNPKKIGDNFRVYNDHASSFLDHTRVLLTNPAYAQAGVFTARTPEEQCDALQRAGYSTSPFYASMLKKIILNEKLKYLDVYAQKKPLSAAA